MNANLYRASSTAPGAAVDWTISVAGGKAIAPASATLTLRGAFGDHVLTEPSTRELATTLYVALAMVRSWAPDAIVTVLLAPTDPDELARARDIASEHRDRVVIVGARPTDPELAYSPTACCGSVAAFWDLGRAGAPTLIDVVECFAPMVDTSDEDAALIATYSLAPYVSFERELLARLPHHVMELAPLAEPVLAMAS